MATQASAAAAPATPAPPALAVSVYRSLCKGLDTLRICSPLSTRVGVTLTLTPSPHPADGCRLCCACEQQHSARTATGPANSCRGGWGTRGDAAAARGARTGSAARSRQLAAAPARQARRSCPYQVAPRLTAALWLRSTAQREGRARQLSAQSKLVGEGGSIEDAQPVLLGSKTHQAKTSVFAVSLHDADLSDLH